MITILYGTLFTMPSATTSYAQIGEWSSPLFNDFLPIIFLGVGISLVFAVMGIIFGIFRRK